MLKRFREYRGEVTAIDQASKTITINTPCGDSVCHYEKLEPEYWDILVDSLRFFDEDDWKREKHFVYIREKQVIDGYQIGGFYIDYVEALSPDDPFLWIQEAEQLDNERNEKGEKTFDKKKLEWLWALFKQYPDDISYPQLGFHECRYDLIDISVDEQSGRYYLGIVVVDLDTHEADIVVYPSDENSKEEDRNFTLNLDKQEDIEKLWDLIRQAKNGVLF